MMAGSNNHSKFLIIEQLALESWYRQIPAYHCTISRRHRCHVTASLFR